MSLSLFSRILLDLLLASLVIPVQSTSECAPTNLPIIMSTSSTSTELAKLIENLSMNQEEGATVCSTLVEGSGVCTQQLLSNLLGLEDDIVDKAAEKFATKLGLQPENTLAQTAVYVVTKAAILEGLQLIGIGGGLAKGDLGGFQMAQLMAKVDEINAKLDIVLTAPLKEAEEFLGMAMIHLANGKVAASIEELRKVKDKAVQAFQYTKGLGKSESLRNAVKTKQLKIFAEVLIQSFDGTKIIPFCHLGKDQKIVISSLIETDLKAIQEFFLHQ